MTTGSKGDWLVVEQLSIHYGRNAAISGLDFDIGRGEAVAIVGSNGAGKSSLLGALAGVSQAGRHVTGRISFQGRALPHGAVADRLGLGIRLVPEADKVFGLLTVEENLKVGLRSRAMRKVAPLRDVGQADIFQWFPRLAERRATLAGNLSGGEQQMLGIAIALLGSPDLLLLDEPTLGLATPVIETLCASLRTLRADLGLTLVVAESDSQWLPHLAERALVLSRGQLVSRSDRLRDGELDRIHDILLGFTQTELAGQGVTDHGH